jgi:hypothetical protein
VQAEFGTRIVAKKKKQSGFSSKIKPSPGRTKRTLAFLKNRPIILITIVFGFAANLPFVGEAFHIDDRLNIYMAKQILRAPGNPYGFSMAFLFGQNRNCSDFYANPPLAG